MKALVIIDIQNDFMPSGRLPVPEGDLVIPAINKEMHSGNYDIIVATQDWHPTNHLSFFSNHANKKPFDVIYLHGISQILWPEHCIQGSFGAEFHQNLDLKPISAIFRKGIDPKVDSYSAFFDNKQEKSTGLHGFLIEKGVKELSFCGLAGDFCVSYSVNDALKLGYKVNLFHEGIRCINPTTFEENRKIWRF